MVFETVVATLINQFLGEYIAGLETKQLSLGIWSGDVVLHDLRLKKDALSKLNLPIDVLDGVLGDLTLSIPWSDLKSKPLKVSINNLHILAAPKALQDYDPVEEDERLQSIKKQKLAAAEQIAVRSKSGSSEEENSFLAQLTTKLIDNLQISISNIHIRYEDPSISTKIPFSVGFTLAELSAVSTDENWNPDAVQTDQAYIYKLLRLSHFGVYWATHSPSFANAEDKKKAFSSSIIHDFKVEPSHQYVLNPVSGEGKIKWQKKHDPTQPRTDLKLMFDEFAFNLDDEQYACFIAVFGSFSRYLKSYPYRKFRPLRSITPKMDPKAWFQYAGKCIINDIHEKRVQWSWDFFKQRRDLRLEYISYYMLLKSGSLDYEGKLELDDLERLLSFDDIRLYRHMALNNLKKSTAPAVQPQSATSAASPEVTSATSASSGTWLGWLTGTNPVTPTSSTRSTTPEPETLLSAADLRQLYDTIEYDPNSVSSIKLQPDSILLNVQWELQAGSFILRRDAKHDSKDLFRATFQKMTVNFCQYPKTMSMDMTLGRVVLVENVMPNSIHPTLIRAKRSNSSPTRDDSMQFVHNPIDGHVDDILSIKMLPLEIVLNPFALRAIADFFSPEKEEFEAMTTLQAVAQDALQGVTAQTRAGLEYAIEEHHRFELLINIDAPIFFIPSDFTDEHAPMLIVDAGHLLIESNPISNEMKERMQSEIESKTSNLEPYLYDKYTFQFTSVQIHVSSGLDDYQEMIDTGSTSGSLMEKVDLSFNVMISIVPKAYDFAKLKIDGELPRLHVNFSDYNYNVVSLVLDATTAAFKTPVVSSSATLSQAVPAAITPETATPIQQQAWYHKLAEPAPLEFGDSNDEFHDAVEEIAADGGSKRTSRADIKSVLITRILCLFTFKCHDLSIAVQTMNRTLATPVTKTLSILAIKGLQVTATQRLHDLVARCHLHEIVIENSSLPVDSPFRRLVGSAQVDDNGVDAMHPGDNNLVDVTFRSVQPASPDFNGTRQSLEVIFNSTRFVISAAWILDIYRFYTTTFRSKPESLQATPISPSPSTPLDIAANSKSANTSPSLASPSSSTTFAFALKVKSVQILIVDTDTLISSGQLNNLAVELRVSDGRTVTNGTIGKLSVIDETELSASTLLRQFLTVDEEQTASFTFELLDSNQSQIAGYDSFLKLRAASLRLTHSSSFVNRLYAYFAQFRAMQSLVDTARKVAEEQALQMQQRAGKFAFDIIIKTPIVVLPNRNTMDQITLYLGEISATNAVSLNTASSGGIALDDQYDINVDSMRVMSVFSNRAQETVAIINNVSLKITVLYFKNSAAFIPGKHITVQLSPISVHLSDDQHLLLIDIWRAMMAGPPAQQPAVRNASDATAAVSNPETAAPVSIVSDIKVFIPTIQLEILNDAVATALAKDESLPLANFVGSDSTFKIQFCSNASMDVEWRFRNLSLYDTRTHKQTSFRDIMIPASDTDDQFALHYSSSATATNIVVTLDRPKLIFDPEHLVAIRAFFFRPWAAPPAPPAANSSSGTSADTAEHTDSDFDPMLDPRNNPTAPTFAYRVNLVEPEIVLLRDPNSAATDAVVLLTDQLVITSEHILALSFHGLGMYLCTMNDRIETQLRFVEDFDATLSLDFRQT
eukprot:jgi/Hompol1/7064/HPOL_002423-RA